MLYSTSLLAVVGAGEQPSLSPRRVSVVTTSERSIIADLYFPEAVTAVRLSRARLLVLTASSASVYALATLQVLETVDTVANLKGVCALSQCALRPLLALPGSAAEGVILVRSAGGRHTLCELRAHRTPLAALAFSPDGALLASCSERGTVVRVHALPSATQTHALRRGLAPAAIHSLAFGPPPAHGPPLLLASSDGGTVHVFRLDPPRCGAPAVTQQQASPVSNAQRAAAAAGAVVSAAGAAGAALLGSLVPHLPRRLRAPVADSLQALRAVLTVKVVPQAPTHAQTHNLPSAPPPAASTRSVVALAAPMTENDEGGDATRAQSTPDGSPLRLLVATYDGVLAEHALTRLRAADGEPAASLVRQSSLLAELTPAAGPEQHDQQPHDDAAVAARWLQPEERSDSPRTVGGAGVDLTQSVSMSLHRSVLG